MKSDSKIQKDVMEEIKYQPYLNPSEIGVSVKEGVVTLSGQVDTYLKKVYAENAAKKVAGVKAVAEDIHVGISPNYKKTDTELASAILSALKWHSAVQDEKLKVKVEDGVVRMEGEVDWAYQKNNARNVVENLSGVKSVLDLVTVKPHITSSEIQNKIKSAFQRSASIDANQITTTVNGSRVKLSGKVRSFAEKQDAENAAWNAPGVSHVESNLEIYLPEYASYVD